MKKSERERLIDELVETAPVKFLMMDDLAEQYRYDLEHMSDDKVLAAYKDALGMPELEPEVETAEPIPPDPTQLKLSEQEF